MGHNLPPALRKSSLRLPRRTAVESVTDLPIGA